MVTQNSLLKIGLAAVVLSGVGIGVWTMDEPSAAVSKSPVRNCCSSWEDHMRNSGIDVDVGKAFDLKPLFAHSSKGFADDRRYTVVRH